MEHGRLNDDCDGGLWVADGFSLADARRAERAAMLAWPAAETFELDGWLVRRTPDTTSRRANSAVAAVWRSGTKIETAILGVEGLYNDHGDLPRFQMSPMSQPAALDGILADRGYGIEAPVRVMTTTPSVDARASRWRVQVDETVDPVWHQAFVEASPSSAEADGRVAMVERAKSRGLAVGYASVRDETGHAASIGVGVFAAPGSNDDADGGWALVFSMNTLESHRRQGMGRAILNALMTRALAIGCDAAYLQVESGNPGAIAVYEGLGFRDLYAYHYRTRFRRDETE